MRRPIRTAPAAAPARGLSLIAVISIVAVGGLAIMGAFRMALTAEQATGGITDQSRTFAAAEAMLRDAEADIRGRLPNTTNATDIWAPDPGDGGLGQPCRTGSAGAGLIWLGCRKVDATPGSSTNYLWFPRSAYDFGAIYSIASTVAATTRCSQGICVPDSMADLANLHTPAKLPDVFAAGASYGSYTGATPSDSDGNLSLSQNRTATSLPADGQPWSRYWIEVFIYSQAASAQASAASDLVPDPAAPYIYRITAIAQGRKPGSRVVLREVFVPNPISQNP